MNYYDRSGQPINMMAWARLFQDREPVGQTEVHHKAGRKSEHVCTVSTVWLGIDQRFVGDGPPLIFETMVFGGSNDQYQRRYSTEAEAIAGHQATVDACKARLILGEVAG